MFSNMKSFYRGYWKVCWIFDCFIEDNQKVLEDCQKFVVDYLRLINILLVIQKFVVDCRRLSNSRWLYRGHLKVSREVSTVCCALSKNVEYSIVLLRKLKHLSNILWFYRGYSKVSRLLSSVCVGLPKIVECCSWWFYPGYSNVCQYSMCLLRISTSTWSKWYTIGWRLWAIIYSHISFSALSLLNYLIMWCLFIAEAPPTPPCSRPISWLLVNVHVEYGFRI